MQYISGLLRVPCIGFYGKPILRPCRLAEAEGDSDSPGTWIRLAELESRSISLQREVQESRGEALDAEAALKLAIREVDSMQKVRRTSYIKRTKCEDSNPNPLLCPMPCLAKKPP